MKIAIHEFELPLRHPFTISRESHTVQPTVIVELQEAGQRGYGEATTNAYYDVTTESLREAVTSVEPILTKCSLAAVTPDTLWASLAPHLSETPFAQCAIDQAAYDLWGKLRNKPVYDLLGLEAQNMPPSCFTIGIDSVDKMVAKMQEMPGWPIYKIKLGTENDVQIIRTLRQHTDAIFRVDANGGWTTDEALRNAEAMQSLGVEFLEQPLPADEWIGHRRLYKESSLPVLADESCIRESDVDSCAGHFHGINIKLVKCGGLTPARRMIDKARQLDMKVMVGCMTESTVGISAIAQLLPLLDYVDMDGATLLAEDIATGVRLERGRCTFSDTVMGSGVALRDKAASS